MSGTTRWWLVRHAQSHANAQGWLSGQLDVALTPAGQEEAARVAGHLATTPLARAVSSDLRRARETAAAIVAGRGVALHTTPALRERALGRWTGRLWRSLPDEERHAVLGSWVVGPPGGEPLVEVGRRAVRYLAGLPDEGPVLVVAHGGVLRALVGLADGLAPEEIPLRHVPNAEAIPRDLPAGYWARVLATVFGEDAGGAHGS